MRAFVGSVLQSLSVEVIDEATNSTRLLIAEGAEDNAARIREFLAGDPSRRAVVLGGEPAPPGSDQTVHLEARPSAVQLRRALRTIVGSGAVQEVAT
jgi:hypothetical protein